jgi:hypothetical protein
MGYGNRQRARALIDYFGFKEINQMAQSIGMTSTHLNTSPGCSGEPNQLTLANAGLAYEGIAGTLLSSQSRLDLYARMHDERSDLIGMRDAVNAIIDQEATRFGLSLASRGQFRARFHIHFNADKYTLYVQEYRSVAGLAEVPTCKRGTVSLKQYVFGLFIDVANSKTNADKTFDATKGETLREPIRMSLSSWSSCYK